VSTRGRVLVCIHKCSFLFLVLTAYIVSAHRAADACTKPLRDARMVKMVSALAETSAWGYKAVLADGTQFIERGRCIQLNRGCNLSRRGNHRDGLVECPHQVAREVNCEVRTRNQLARTRWSHDGAKNVQHHHCLSVAVRHDAVPSSLGQVNGEAGKVCIVLNDVSQERNNVGQHCCLNRTTLKPHAVEDIFRLVGVGVPELNRYVGLYKFARRNQTFEL
jgi:hypothetical protein